MDIEIIKGGTAYVTLEPCSHFGKTPPCVAALIDSGIKRVVIALKDPDKRVNGKGVAALVASGIEVDVGVGASAAFETLEGYFKRQKEGVPHCLLKVATSLDSRIALADFKKRWITGHEMRNYIHLLRSRVDGIITGIGTIISDNPKMTCRLGASPSDSPQLYVFDSLLRTPLGSDVLKRLDQPTFFSSKDVDQERKKALEDAGAKVVHLPTSKEGSLDIWAALKYLGKVGCNTVLIECGLTLATSFVLDDFVDKIYWTQSNHILGDSALPAIGTLPDFGVGKEINDVDLLEKRKYTQAHFRVIGPDRLIILERKRNNNV